MSSDLDIWNNAAGDWSAKVTASDTLRTLLFEQSIKQLLPNLAGLKILDAGCGDGYFTELLTNKGADVLGIEGSEKMIHIAKNKHKDLEFQTADLLQKLSFENNSFEVIFANMVLMHLSDIKMFVSECKRILKPSGKFIFSILHPAFNVPTMNLYKSLLDKLLGRTPSGLARTYFSKNLDRRFESTIGHNLTHYHRTLEEYSQILKTAGFFIEEILEPHDLPDEFLKQNPKLEYATRLPRFIFIKATNH